MKHQEDIITAARHEVELYLGSSEEETVKLLEERNAKGAKHSLKSCVLTNYLGAALSGLVPEDKELKITVLWGRYKGYYYLSMHDKKAAAKDPSKPGAPTPPPKLLWKSDDIVMPDHINNVVRNFDAGKYPNLIG